MDHPIEETDEQPIAEAFESAHIFIILGVIIGGACLCACLGIVGLRYLQRLLNQQQNTHNQDLEIGRGLRHILGGSVV